MRVNFEIDPAWADIKAEILFQNERLLRTLTKLEKAGSIDMERIFILTLL